jgi:hypothetical protein
MGDAPVASTPIFASIFVSLILENRDENQLFGY